MWKLIKKLWPYLIHARPFQKTIFIIILYILTINLLSLVPPFLTRFLFDVVIPAKDLQVLIYVLVALIVSGMIIFGFTSLKDYLITLVNQGINYNIQTFFYFHVVRLPQQIHDRISFGELMKRVEDCTAIGGIIHVIIVDFYQNLLGILVYIPAIFFINWKLSLVKIIAFPISIFISRFFVKKDLEYEQINWEAGSLVSNHFNQTFHGVRVIKAFGLENRVLRKMKQLVLRQRKLSVERKLFNYFWSFTSGLTGDIVNSSVLFFAAAQMIAGKLSFGEFFAFNILAEKAIASLNGFFGIMKNVVGVYNAISRYEEIMILPEEFYGKYDDSINFKVKGNICFENVWFGYNPKEPVIKGLSFTIPAGSKIALVGRSGSGKTTIINLLLRFYDPFSGKIYIDDHDIIKLPVRQLRNNIAVVLQENYFFDGTILDNLTFGRRDVSIDQVIDACRLANAYDFINQLPQGPYTLYGSKGINLSGGQKQRLAIARAFLRNPAILILDEATSALDLENERLIQESLQKLMEGRTTITIAHRLSTIVNSDIIFVIEDGQIYEMGTHDELLGKRGFYYDLYTKMGMIG
jgi:ABC-type bacteriocin/lantibiotic exporter with double-glycine peptidase domain